MALGLSLLAPLVLAPNAVQSAPAFWVRPGYSVTLVAEDLRTARFMEFDPNGTLYVSQPAWGTIQSFRLHNGKYLPVGDFITGRYRVHAMHYQGGWLWYTTPGAIYRSRDTDGDGIADRTVTVIPEGQLPSEPRHWTRSLCVTPDAIYTSIGDSLNASDERATDRQKIWRYNRDGTGKTLWSSGIRNTEKLRFRPGTNDLYGADHGSDWFGRELGENVGQQAITDSNPPDEFNKYVQGGFYGHPFLTGNRLPRPEFQSHPELLQLASQTIVPAWNLDAHCAPNGWTFLRTNALGPGFARDALVACHGSNGALQKVGYKVERLLFDKVLGTIYGAQPLVVTLSQAGEVLARPVDVVEAPDGSVLFSDDYGKRIYRIRKV